MTSSVGTSLGMEAAGGRLDKESEEWAKKFKLYPLYGVITMKGTLI